MSAKWFRCSSFMAVCSVWHSTFNSAFLCSSSWCFAARSAERSFTTYNGAVQNTLKKPSAFVYKDTLDSNVQRSLRLGTVIYGGPVGRSKLCLGSSLTRLTSGAQKKLSRQISNVKIVKIQNFAFLVENELRTIKLGSLGQT